jgi:putative hydrolase of the HAD superfamily
MIRAVVFDLWNTLVHSRHGDPFQHLKRLFSPLQLTRFEDVKREAMDRPHPDAHAFVAGWRDRLSLTPDQEEGMVAAFQSAVDDADCFPEALEALRETRRLARVALLSNTQNFDMRFLDRLGLQDLLPHRFLSAELGVMKPDAKAFQAAQKKMGLFPGEMAMVGDSWRDDVAGALGAGWTAIWVNRRGLPRPDHDPEAEVVEIPDLSLVPSVIRDLQAGARCSTCLS